MKVLNQFMLRQIMDDYILIPVGEAALQFSAILTTNQVGAFLWENLQEETSLDELVSKVVEVFEVDEPTARADTQAFLEELKTHGVLCQ